MRTTTNTKDTIMDGTIESTGAEGPFHPAPTYTLPAVPFNLRDTALRLAIDSLESNGTPPGSEAITERAEVFFGFLVGVESTPAGSEAGSYRRTLLASLIAARDHMEAESPGLSGDGYVQILPCVHDVDMRPFALDDIDLNDLIAALEA